MVIDNCEISSAPLAQLIVMPSGTKNLMLAPGQVEGFDRNCPQHILVRFEADDVKRALAQREQRFAVPKGELTPAQRV